MKNQTISCKHMLQDGEYPVVMTGVRFWQTGSGNIKAEPVINNYLKINGFWIGRQGDVMNPRKDLPNGRYEDYVETKSDGFRRNYNAELRAAIANEFNKITQK